MRNYAGWWISSGGGPVTGKWVAYKFGVTMRAGTQEDLINMIDARIKDDIMNRSGMASLPR